MLASTGYTPREDTTLLEALVKYANAPGAVEIRDMPRPAIRPDQVLLRGPGRRHLRQRPGDVSPPVFLPGRPAGYSGPRVFGHGRGDRRRLRNFLPGDRVVSETAAYVCGECVECRTGNYNRARSGWASAC